MVLLQQDKNHGFITKQKIGIYVVNIFAGIYGTFGLL